jgi:methionine synthase / methylenetetrahydrofolate reductase (NADH)
MLETIERMAKLTTVRLAAQPNAGRPRDVDGRNLYLCSPEYMASYARRFIASGVRLVGGCCGTTAAHIHQIKAAARNAAAPAEPRRQKAVRLDGQAEPMAPIDRREKSALGRALDDGQFVVVAEVAAPRGMDLSSAIAQANTFHELGAVAVNIPDYPKSGARASALALSVLIEQQSHVETLLHYSCRDRNLIGMQSDLLGAHAMGLRNVLLTTGEPPRQGTYLDATSVFDVDAIGLTNMVAQLNRGQDIGGQSIGAPTRFHIGVGVNPFAPNLDAEWRRLDYKVEAGAEFIMTPPVLDMDAFERVLPRLKQTGLPIVVGVVALDSVRQVEFLASEVPIVRVPDRALERLRVASDAAAEGLAMTVEIAQRLRPIVQGIHVTGLHGSPHATEQLLMAMGQNKTLKPEVRG